MINTVTLEGFVTQVPDENGLMMMEYLPYRLNFNPGQRKQTQTVYVDVRKMPPNMRVMIGRKARVVVHGGFAGCAQEDDEDDLYLGPHIRAVRVVVCDEPVSRKDMDEGEG